MRAFIVGNGPSLAWTPLDKLAGEVTFAMNRVNLIYPTVAWRPTYYFAMDFIGFDMQADMAINVAEAQHSFIRADRCHEFEMRRPDFEWPSRVSYMWPCLMHVGCSWKSAHRPEGWHLPNVCRYGSTLNIAMQVAVLMSYDPLYLVGCDLGFKPYEKLDNDSADPNHFHPGYSTRDDFPVGERDQTLAHMHAVAERSSPAKIYNATLGGLLEEHERVAWEGLWP